MTIDEFDAVCKAFNRAKEEEMHDGWARMRMHASICIQPHVRKRISPKDLIKFPWEVRHSNKPIPSREEAMKEYHSLMQRLQENGEGNKI